MGFSAAPRFLRYNSLRHVNHVAEIDKPYLAADGEDPIAPIGVIYAVAGQGFQAAVVAQPVAAHGLELEQENALARGIRGPEFGLALQDFQGDAEIEAAFGLFRLGDDKGLERREIMRQSGHGRGKTAGKLQLVRHEVDGKRQLRGGQDFLARGDKQVLRRHALLHALAYGLEKISLFNVFFAG